MSSSRPLAALLGALLVFAVAFGVGRWLLRKPFAHAEPVAVDASIVDVDVVRREQLRDRARSTDAGTDSSVDAATDAAMPAVTPDVFLHGRVPGPEWAERTRNFLLVGVDRKPWGSGAALADTILLVAVDRPSGHVGLVSIPRDYYVELAPETFGRINGAFAFAARNGLERLPFLANEVTELLGVPIESVVVVDLTVLESTVDAVGGVDVDVPCPIRDNFVDPRTPTGRRMLDVSPGQVHMDGVTAAMYARSRHGRSDWDRARRQQAVILAVRRKVTSATAIPLLPQLLGTLEDHVETELTNRDLLALTKLAMRIDPANLHGMVLASTNSQAFRTEDGRAVLIPNPDLVREQIRTLFEAPPPGVDPRKKACADADAALNGRTAAPVRDGGTQRAPREDGDD